MSDSTTETKPKLLNRKFGFGWLTFALVGLLGLLLLSMGVGTGLVEAVFVLLAGWASFLSRTGPRIHWNFDLIAMGVICTAVALLLAHWLVRGLVRKVGEARGTPWAWPWRWTWCGATVVAISFVVGMAVGGVVHQVGWINSSPEPLMESKGVNWEAHSNIRTLDLAFRIAADETTNNLVETRRAMWNTTNGFFRSPSRSAAAMQSSHMLLILGEGNVVRGSVIFPRDPTVAAKLGGSFTLDGNAEWLPWEQLQTRLKEHSAKLVSY